MIYKHLMIYLDIICVLSDLLNSNDFAILVRFILYLMRVINTY